MGLAFRGLHYEVMASSLPSLSCTHWAGALPASYSPQPPPLSTSQGAGCLEVALPQRGETRFPPAGGGTAGGPP